MVRRHEQHPTAREALYGVTVFKLRLRDLLPDVAALRRRATWHCDQMRLVIPWAGLTNVDVSRRLGGLLLYMYLV